MKKLSLFGVLLTVFLGSNTWAALSGTITSNPEQTSDTSGGLAAINTLTGTINWVVEKITSGPTVGKWKYTYTYAPYTSGKPRGVGAVSIQLGSLLTDLQSTLTYISSTAVPPAVTYPDVAGGLQTIDRTLSGSGTYTYDSWMVAEDPTNTRINVTTTFKGLQWILDTTNPTGSSFKLEFTTALAPIWGDIYFDGYNTTANDGYSMLRNVSFDAPYQPFTPSGPVISGKMPVPGFIPPAIDFNMDGKPDILWQKTAQANWLSGPWTA
jgi:hypothetical protein